MDKEESWLTEEELKILNTAAELGYFDSPRRITLDSLAEKLMLNSQQLVYTTYGLEGKLRAINKKVLMKFIEKMNTPLKG